MKNEEQLSKLFKLAREQEVLLNSGDIQDLLDKPIIKNKPNSKAIKAMTITTLILAVAGTFGILFNSNKHTKKITPNKIVKTVITKTQKSLQKAAYNQTIATIEPILGSPNPPYQTIDDTSKSKKVKLEKRMIIEEREVIIDNSSLPTPNARFEIENDSGYKKIESNFIVKSVVRGKQETDESHPFIAPGFEKETFVHLNKNDLKKIGIFIKDGIFMYEMNDTRLGSFKSFFGSKDSEAGSNFQSSNSKVNGKNPLAMFITGVDGEIKNVLGLFHSPSKIEAKDIAPSLLPIWVEDENSSNKKAYIAWFEMNDQLIDLLPETIQQNLKKDNQYYKHTLPEISIENNVVLTDSIIKEAQKEETIKTNLVSKEQIIVPSDDLLKKLGFSSSNPIVFNRTTPDGNQISIISNSYSTNTNIKIGDIKNGEYSLQTILPDFFTNYDSINNSVFNISMFFKENDNIQQINQNQYFDMKKYELIGLWIKGKNANKIMWYKMNDALLNELKADERVRVVNYTNANKNNLKDVDINVDLPEVKSFDEIVNSSGKVSTIPTITLSDYQLAKLLIKVVDKKIVQKIPSENSKNKEEVKALQLSFSKHGTEIEDEVLIENYDKDSYVLPVLLTDNVGQYGRASFSNEEKYQLDKITTYNLIPVLVKSGDDFTTMDELTMRHRPDIIFWYEPTEKFLKLLDKKTSDEIRNDLVSLECKRSKFTFTSDTSCNNKTEMSCNYYEACQNKLNKAITKYSVYPNPASEQFNLKLDLKQSCAVSVTMYKLNGEIVKRYDLGTIEKGIFEKQLQITNTASGIYLLKITTDKGDVMNERIVIAHK